MTTTDPAIAEQHRIERQLAGLRVGESTIINGVTCTAISLAEAERLMAAQVKAGGEVAS